MSRRSLLARKRLLQRGQIITKSERSGQERRDQRYPADVWSALQGMMRNAYRLPKEEKVIKLAAHKARSR